MPRRNISGYRLGIGFAAVGVTLLSFDALLIRLAKTTAWDVLFWRGFFLCIVMACLTAWQNQWPRAMFSRRTSLIALAVAILYGSTTALFVLSITHTKVANTVVILAVSPFFAAVFSWWLLRERLKRHTLVAVCICTACIFWMFADSLSMRGNPGDLFAILLALLMGLALTLLRLIPDYPRILIISVSGLFACLIAAPMASPFSLSGPTYGWLALMGCIQIPLASLLLLSATRYLPAPEVSLFLLIETILGPFWVWLALREQPPALTLYGGSIIILCIVLHSWISMKSKANMQ